MWVNDIYTRYVIWSVFGNFDSCITHVRLVKNDYYIRSSNDVLISLLIAKVVAHITRNTWNTYENKQIRWINKQPWGAIRSVASHPISLSSGLFDALYPYIETQWSLRQSRQFYLVSVQNYSLYRFSMFAPFMTL